MRLSVFDAVRKQSIKEGMTPEQVDEQLKIAAAAAKNSSVNFEKKGTAGYIINTYFLFANAGIQGAALTIKAAKDKRSIPIMALGLTAAMAVRAALHMSLDDDEVDMLVNASLLNEGNIIIPNPINGKHVTIPKPYSALRIMFTAGERAVDMAMGKKSAFNVAADLIGQTNHYCRSYRWFW